ncbi:MAG TPA: LPS assembly lipoprotein LptE [Bacteroidales bacterium]|nr:LPS assembly lipoprotein LptE [Bacteroidales bacterium]
MALAIVIVIVLAGSCTVKYSFSGANTGKLRTLNIQRFQNKANLVQPGVSNQLTNSLIDKCKAQTKLNIVNGSADAVFEGDILEYNTKPLTVGGDSRAAMARFTIKVRVKFTNTLEPENSFEQTFTKYKDYEGTQDLSSVESSLVDTIIDLLVEDIFNEAFAKW